MALRGTVLFHACEVRCVLVPCRLVRLGTYAGSYSLVHVRCSKMMCWYVLVPFSTCATGAEPCRWLMTLYCSVGCSAKTCKCEFAPNTTVAVACFVMHKQCDCTSIVFRSVNSAKGYSCIDQWLSSWHGIPDSNKTSTLPVHANQPGRPWQGLSHYLNYHYVNELHYLSLTQCVSFQL